MKNTKFLFLTMLPLYFLSCKGATQNKTPVPEKTNIVSQETLDSVKRVALNKIAIINEKDPVCGMSLIRGFDDTVLYHGQLIGFCSKECKDDFLKKPSSYPTAKK